jgi:hypothetical protein
LSGVSFASPRYAKHLIPGTPKQMPPVDRGRMGDDVLVPEVTDSRLLAAKTRYQRAGKGFNKR